MYVSMRGVDIRRYGSSDWTYSGSRPILASAISSNESGVPCMLRRTHAHHHPPSTRQAHVHGARGDIQTSDMAHTFRYQALDDGLSQIRVFSLFPASDHNAPLRGRLHTAQFSPTPPVYETISYVWAERPGEELLEVNDNKLVITFNLASVLRRVRYTDRIRNLWIDAVCIDQNSPKEKSQQVRKMNRIYSSASRVLIWLGTKVLSHTRDCNHQRLWMSDEESNEEINRVMDYLERLQNQGFEGIEKEEIKFEVETELLFACKWWKRVWTIQEGVVANEHSLVLWGSREISWASLFDLVERVNLLGQVRHPERPYELPVSKFARVYQRYRLSGTIPLEDLIYASYGRSASDPRDLVYALLGLVKRQPLEPFEPDYTQKSTWAFQKAVVGVVKERKDLEFLLNIVVRRSEVNFTKKPSWAHDFTERTLLLSTRLKYGLFRRYDLVQEGASTGRGFSGVQHDAQAGTIKITGAIVGPVAESQTIFTDCYSELAEDEHNGMFYMLFLRQHLNAFVPWLLQTLQDFTHIARKAWSKRFSPDEVNAKVERGDVWRVALDGRSMDNLKSRIKQPMPKAVVDEWTVLQRYSALDTWRHMLSQEKRGLAEDPEFSIAKSLYRHMVSIFSIYPRWKGCLFTTTSGYVASAGMEVQSGDVLCILFGCFLPLVLRPQNDGTYIIVDAAYVEGIMEGEFLQDRSSYTDTEFVIS